MNMAMVTPRNALNRQHPFVLRLLKHVNLTAADLDALDAIVDGEFTIRRRHDLIIDGYEYRKLSFVKDGYAVRYKLLRNGKRQILNVVLPGDIIGMPGSFYERASYSVMAISFSARRRCIMRLRCGTDSPSTSAITSCENGKVKRAASARPTAHRRACSSSRKCDRRSIGVRRPTSMTCSA